MPNLNRLLHTQVSGSINTEQKPDVSIERIIEAPVKDVWDLVGNFGLWPKWSPIYASMEILPNDKLKVKNEDKNIDHDTDGEVRQLVGLDGTVIREKLVTKDNDNHTLIYDYGSVEKAPGEEYQLFKEIVKNVRTTIILEQVQPSLTKIKWTSVNYFIDNPASEKQVQQMTKTPYTQAYIYKSEINALKQYFLVNNIYQGAYNFLYSKQLGITKALLTGQEDANKAWAYDNYQFTLREGWKYREMPKMVKGIPYDQVLSPHKIGQMFARLAEVIYLQTYNNTEAGKAGKLVDYKPEDVPAPPKKQAEAVDPIKLFTEPIMQLARVYGDVSKTAEEEEKVERERPIQDITQRLIDKWEDDAYYCQQLLQGVNPLHIRLVVEGDKETVVPKGMKDLKAGNESVKDLIADRRLFILDYKLLTGFNIVKQPEGYPQTYFSDPVMLVYRKPKSKELGILGIQLTHEENATVYTPDGHKNRFKLAKMAVACADNQVHEFAYHLGLAHLFIEPTIVAVHNTLQGHEIGDFLRPHFEDTIGINFLARQTLVASDGKSYNEAFTNRTFALGTQQAVELVTKYWDSYDFFKNNFENDLKSRNFDEKKSDGLETYYYRDDGFLLWNAMGNYAKNTVDALYNDDSAVLRDHALQKWGTEMASKDRANVKGFPELKDKATLVKVLQTIVWNGSALHWSINGPQWPYLGLSPNRPNALFSDMPAEDGKDISPLQYYKALSRPFPALFQITFSWLLSLPSEKNLVNLPRLRAFQKGSSLDAKLIKVSEDFQKELKEVTQKIVARNEKIEEKGDRYIFLIPENVASSVNI